MKHTATLKYNTAILDNYLRLYWYAALQCIICDC